jgi:hypothetical protein
MYKSSFGNCGILQRDRTYCSHIPVQRAVLLSVATLMTALAASTMVVAAPFETTAEEPTNWSRGHSSPISL